VSGTDGEPSPSSATFTRRCLQPRRHTGSDERVADIPVTGREIPLADDGREHRITVVLG